MISETAVQEFTVQVTQESTPTHLPTFTATPIPVSQVEKGDKAFFNGDWDIAIIEYILYFYF